MSFKRPKTPKVEAAPPAPVPPVAEIATPQSSRSRRLSTQGRQSTFLGSLIGGALPTPGPTLTGLNRGG